MKNLRVLNRNHIKYIALVTMLIDHYAWAFVPLASEKGQVMHFIGRFTAAVMAFFLAEGFRYTRDKKAYGLRLFIFSMLTWAPYVLFEGYSWPRMEFSMISALFLAFLTLVLWDWPGLAPTWKFFFTAMLLYMGQYCDWWCLPILWALVSHYVNFHEEPEKWLLCFSGVSALGCMVMMLLYPSWGMRVHVLGLLVPGLFLYLFYNGKPGSKHPVHKWIFYVVYPLQFLVFVYMKKQGILLF